MTITEKDVLKAHEAEKLRRLKENFRKRFGVELANDTLLFAIQAKIDSMQQEVLKEHFSHYKASNSEDVAKIFLTREVQEELMRPAPKTQEEVVIEKPKDTDVRREPRPSSFNPYPGKGRRQ